MAAGEPTILECELAIMSACEADLLEYVREAWHVVEPGQPFQPNWHIEAICEHLQAVTQGQIRRLIINIPPRCMKSLAVSVFWPTWEWGPFDRPQTRWLFASYAQSLSTRDSVKCRRIIRSPWYQERWGDRYALTNDQNAKIRFENDRMGYRLATSVGGALTGEGGDRIAVDDPHNAVEGESEAVRRATLDWWDLAMSTRLNDPKRGSMVIIQQRLHEDDLTGHVLAREQGWEILCLPMRFEGDHPTRSGTSLRFEDPRRKDGELLWPARVGEKEVRELETRLGPYGASGQLQQRPSPAGGGLFRREWFRYFADEGKWYRCLDTNETVLKDRCWRIITADTATSTSEINDYSVRGVIDIEIKEGTQRQQVFGRMFLIDLWRDRLPVPRLEAFLRSEQKRWKPMLTAMEKVGDGDAMYQRLVHDGVAMHRMKYGESWEIPDKVTKSVCAQVACANGRLYFLDQAPWLGDLEHELLLFPEAAHDDQADVISMAAHLVQGRNPLKPPVKPKFAPGSFGAILGHEKLAVPKHDPKDPFA